MLTLTDRNFATEVWQSRLPVLVDFYADWCGPCQIAGSAIKELAKEYKGKIKFGKLNVDENPQTAEKYRIMSIPVVVVFQKGQEIVRKVGFDGKSGYLKLIKEIKWSTI